MIRDEVSPRFSIIMESRGLFMLNQRQPERTSAAGLLFSGVRAAVWRVRENAAAGC
ncbi:hypothetical protein MHH28_00575 [Paenibacillus sp. FSL K6-1217]|uniref:hypothetical protein n=1 Tax=Paenibacillus sp. FSL K6-1217 TaxID=2921466 RepID=UPI0032519F1A